MWKKAKRNIIDIEDVVSIVMILLKKTELVNTKINIANPINYKVSEIVKNLEILNTTKADYNLIDKGNESWHIDISEVSEIIKNNKINFDQNYLHKVLKKYYF